MGMFIEKSLDYHILEKYKVWEFQDSLEIVSTPICLVWTGMHSLIRKPCDVNNSFSSFYNKFNKLISKHAPMKTTSNLKAKQLSKPWITKGIYLFFLNY